MTAKSAKPSRFRNMVVSLGEAGQASYARTFQKVS